MGKIKFELESGGSANVMSAFVLIFDVDADALDTKLPTPRLAAHAEEASSTAAPIIPIRRVVRTVQDPHF
jgi:hypothetical protein